MHMLLVYFFMACIMIVIIEFSYSEMYNNSQYQFLLLVKIIGIIMEISMGSVRALLATGGGRLFLFMLAFSLRSCAHDCIPSLLSWLCFVHGPQILGDALVISPVVIAMNFTELLITMGASSFTNFVVAYFVDLSMNVVERLYIDPAIKAVFVLYKKWIIQCRRAFRKNRVMLTREQRKAEDREWKAVLDDIARETEGVEPLLDSYLSYSNSIIALYLSPLVQVFLLITDTMGYKVTRIPEMYEIRSNDLKYYTQFQAIIIVFTLAMDMFLLNTLELVHGWRLYDYVSYQKYRFTVREKRWQISSNQCDDAISEELQRVDLLCFSSQFYFMITCGGYAIFMLLIGITVFLRDTWNVFGDPVLVLLIILCMFIFFVFKHVLVIFANLVGIWRIRGNEGRVDDDVDAKLRIAEMQKDMEMEQIELRALNSERFRHRFLERSRPWILQHLTELLTPRTLNMLGADGRPNVEYIRDLYHQLTQMEGVRAEGDRSDISSDDEDADELMARQRAAWSRKPLTPSAHAIMMMWLDRVRWAMAVPLALTFPVRASALSPLCHLPCS
jgi:hypothetical protein